jgi:6-phosphofructokinase 1
LTDDEKGKLEEIKTALTVGIEEGRIASGETRKALRDCLLEIWPLARSLPRRRDPIYKLDKDPDLRARIRGRLRTDENRRLLLADLEILKLFFERGIDPPSFVEAGPRAQLAFDPRERMGVAIVTSGGPAPGLNTVVHNLVARHEEYCLNARERLEVLAALSGLAGLRYGDFQSLTSDRTEGWIDRGGCELGVGRPKELDDQRDGESSDDFNKRRQEYVEHILNTLKHRRVRVLYVIGGDGSLGAAADIQKAAERREEFRLNVVGVPKTMDNDVMWCWETFGFETAVNEAARLITALHRDVRATKRIMIVQLFGRQAGFVATLAHNASGVSDLLLIPEVMEGLSDNEQENLLKDVIRVAVEKMYDTEPQHGVIVLAEGVMPPGTKDSAQALARVVKMVEDAVGSVARRLSMDAMPVKTSEPGYIVRAVPPAPTDQNLCRRLANVAADCAMAGYYGFYVSQLLTEYVMVPFELLNVGTKAITLDGMLYAMSGHERSNRASGMADE